MESNLPGLNKNVGEDIATNPSTATPFPAQRTAKQAGASPASPTLNPWDQGPAVMELQELLCAQGFPLRIDGDFGSRTEEAVWTFQRQKGLRMDGVVGPQTWAALRASVEPGARILHLGCVGEDVRELQGLLQVCGYNIRRDGIFGEKTHEAVVSFQQHHHLHDDGRVCPVTWNVLRAGKPVKLQHQRRWLNNFRRWW